MRESIAIAVFQQQRSKEFMQPLFAVTDPEKAGELLKKYRGVIFPEHKYDDMKYYKRASNYFEKMRDVDLTASIVH